jgi:hypothetical protein
MHNSVREEHQVHGFWEIHIVHLKVFVKFLRKILGVIDPHVFFIIVSVVTKK